MQKKLAPKCLSHGHNRMIRVRFKPSPCRSCLPSIRRSYSLRYASDRGGGGGGGGFTRPIPRDGGRGSIPRNPNNRATPHGRDQRSRREGCGRKWPDAEGLVQGSRARDVRDPVVPNYSCCMKESWLDPPCGDKS